MPTYEYRCEACDNTFDVVQGFSDDPLTTCEACGGRLRKVFAPVGIVFKGSGFYKTDSRSKGSTTPAPSAPNEPATTADSPTPASAADSGAAKAAPAAPPTSAAAKAD